MKFPVRPTLEDLSGRTLWGQRIPTAILSQPGAKSPTDPVVAPTSAKDIEAMREQVGQNSQEPPFDPANSHWLTNLPPGDKDTQEYSPLPDYKPKLLSGEDKRSEASTGDVSAASRKPTGDFPEMTDAERLDIKEIGTPPNKAWEKWLERPPQVW